jgi:hypothetical protein
LERESEAEPFTQADMDDLVAAWKNLPNIDADTMLDPDEFPPTCQNYGVSAPQRADLLLDGLEDPLDYAKNQL